MKLFTQTKTVDSVMAVFTKTIADLNEVADKASAKAEQIQNQRNALLEEQKAAEAEVVKAATLSTKLVKLLGL